MKLCNFGYLSFFDTLYIPSPSLCQYPYRCCLFLLYRQSVVLFTSKDYLRGESLQTFVAFHAHPKVQELVRKCGGRCVGFDNALEQDDKDDQLEELLEQIDKIGNLGEFIIPSKTAKSWFFTKMSEFMNRLIQRKFSILQFCYFIGACFSIVAIVHFCKSASTEHEWK